MNNLDSLTVKPTIRVMLSYARSGGTLLNRCMSSAENIIMLSEISPVLSAHGAFLDSRLEKLTIYWQMKEWYGIEISKEGSFLEQIKEVYRFCEAEGKFLVIRDWTYISFTQDPKLQGYEPSYSFDIINELEQSFEVLPFGLVRNSIDVWLSMGRPHVNKFFSSYFTFISGLDNLNIYILKFEGLTADPVSATVDLFKYLNIPYDIDLDSISAEKRITGDVAVKDSFRGGNKKYIKVLTRKPLLPWEYAMFSKNKKGFERINRYNDYPTAYFNEEYTILKYLSSLIVKIRGKIGF